MILKVMALVLVSSVAAAAPNFSGVWDCPAYEGKRDDGKPNAWGATRETIEQKELAGMTVMATSVEETSPVQKGSLKDKYGPYKKTLYVVDGLWRFHTMYRNNTLVPVKTKTEFDGEKIKWYAEYPDYVDNAKKKEKARKGEGAMWINKNGDMVATGSHFVGEMICKRVVQK